MFNNVITFTDVSQSIDELYHPYSASQSLPDWYKNTASYIGGKKTVSTNELGLKGVTAATVKKCMPVFDSLTAGYIIPLPSDLNVTTVVEQGQLTKRYEWAMSPKLPWMSSSPLVEFHGYQQAEQYPMPKISPKDGLAKLLSPWGIKTPPGYSSLFVAPMHRGGILRILEGVVDTDQYISPVAFPFYLTDPNFEGVISAGTPLVQVIPFKRESWKVQVAASAKDVEAAVKLNTKIRSVFLNGYKTFAWSKKSFK